jgi:hypothetical protein
LAASPSIGLISGGEASKLIRALRQRSGDSAIEMSPAPRCIRKKTSTIPNVEASTSP